MQDLEMFLLPPEKLFPILQQQYMQTITSGGYLLVFLSQDAVSGDYPLIEAPHYAHSRLKTTFFVWLQRSAEIRLHGENLGLAELPPGNVFEFAARPMAPNFDHRQLDSLMVRLYWLIYRNNDLI
jgi:hypothetical protein